MSKRDRAFLAWILYICSLTLIVVAYIAAEFVTADVVAIVGTIVTVTFAAGRYLERGKDE